MSQRILGVDLGAYSVKVAELQTGFRQLQVVALHERLVPPGDLPWQERAAQALADLVSDRQLWESTVFVSLPGSQASLRTLTLPFSDPKKIEPVLPFELESLLPFSLDEVTIDWVELGRTPEATRLLAVAARKDAVRQLIDRVAAAVGAEPRAVFLAPLCYRPLYERLPADGEGEAPTRAIVDIGHLQTNVCMLHGRRVVHARTLSRGGQALTAAIARAYQRPEAEAEAHKHARDVGIYPDGEAPSPKLQQLSEVLLGAADPLCLDLNQTFAAHRAEGGTRPVELLVTGGGARLRGLPALLEARLGIPVRPLPLPVLPGLQPDAQGAEAAALALATALLGVDGRRDLDLRRGELAYKADFSFLRARAMQIAACALAVLAASAVDAYAALYKLRREETQLTERLKKETQEVFGQAMTDPEEVSKRMKLGRKGVDVPTVEATALDLLDEISTKLPGPDKGKIDLTELELRGKKSFLKGTSESATIVDEIAKGLESIECFDDVQKGQIQNLPGDKELKSWSITVSSRCP